MPSRKTRSEIPALIAAAVLFRSDRTCCVCRERGKPLQIHHIDEDPSNHDPENLAALCFHCHDETQRRGGFSRKLDAHQVLEYRDDWLTRVQSRRDKADQIAIAAIAVAPGATPSTELSGSATAQSHARGTLTDAATAKNLSDYIWRIPSARASAYADARPRWDSGVTAVMLEATYDVIAVMERILANLADFYPAGHFGGPVQEFIDRMIAARFEWHRAHMEPNGAGKHGTMIGPMAASSVLSDAEAMVDEMVGSLAIDRLGDFQLSRWRAEWSRVV